LFQRSEYSRYRHTRVMQFRNRSRKKLCARCYFKRVYILVLGTMKKLPARASLLTLRTAGHQHPNRLRLHVQVQLFKAPRNTGRRRLKRLLPSSFEISLPAEPLSHTITIDPKSQSSRTMRGPAAQTPYTPPPYSQQHTQRLTHQYA
jgi:hypothetical protein